MDNCKECTHRVDCDWNGGCEAFELDLAEHDKLIRDETIDKYTEKLRPIVSQLRSALKNNSYAFIDLDCIAEQMKEEQNEGD